jgi:hypothetical protein
MPCRQRRRSSECFEVKQAGRDIDNAKRNKVLRVTLALFDLSSEALPEVGGLHDWWTMVCLLDKPIHVLGERPH